MYHPNLVPDAVLRKYCIGKMETGAFPTYYDWDNDTFYKTMKRKVVQHLKENGIHPWHDSPTLYLKTAFIIAGYLITLRYTWQGSFLAAMGLGVFSAQIGMCVMHDGAHGAFSSRPWINTITAWGMDVIGSSTFVWEAHHNTGHHPFTNLVSKDRNTQENDPDVFSSYPMLRMTPYDAWKPHHRFQYIYGPILFSFLTLSKLYYDIVNLCQGRVNDVISLRPRLSNSGYLFRIIFMKIASLGYLLAVPIWFNGPLKGIALFVTAHCVCGVVLSVMFIVSHIADDADFVINAETKAVDGEDANKDANKDALSRSWAAIQCRSSTNWGEGSTFWTHFSGGLNYQLEHHLFPSISHVYYPTIYPVVKQVCKDFGVPYKTHGSIVDALSHTIKHLSEMGLPPEVEEKKGE